MNLGVEVREHADALELEADVLVLATGAASAPLAAKLGLEQKFEWLISRNFVTMVQVQDDGRRVFFDDF